MMDSTVTPMLQGPSSLPSREVPESSDFIIITGNGESTNGYDDSDQDLFGSLSQADAVAQLREVMQQRDILHSMCNPCLFYCVQISIKFQF